MVRTLFSRRDFSLRLAAFCSALSVPTAVFGTSGGSQEAHSKNEISRDCECIHQEVVFKATRKRVYDALTEQEQFKQVTSLSIPGASTEISKQAGGAFSLFGGQILGRQIELVQDERIVQAWRDKDWTPGVYSIAEFQLTPQGGETKLVFDHTGFPRGSAEHLATGWTSHYWGPLQKYLS